MRARILVTGARACRDVPTARDQIHAVLQLVREQEFFSDAVLVHGAAEGADLIASAVWREMGGETEPHPARWNVCVPDCKPNHRKFRGDRSYCPQAGFRRNREMVELGADLCLAFLRGPSRGTRNTADMAERAGIETRRIEVTG